MLLHHFDAFSLFHSIPRQQMQHRQPRIAGRMNVFCNATPYAFRTTLTNVSGTVLATFVRPALKTTLASTFGMSSSLAIRTPPKIACAATMPRIDPRLFKKETSALPSTISELAKLNCTEVYGIWMMMGGQPNLEGFRGNGIDFLCFKR